MGLWCQGTEGSGLRRNCHSSALFLPVAIDPNQGGILLLCTQCVLFSLALQIVACIPLLVLSLLSGLYNIAYFTAQDKFILLKKHLQRYNMLFGSEGPLIRVFCCVAVMHGH